MKNSITRFFVRLLQDQDGQGQGGQSMVENILVLALIALGAIVGMKGIATAINGAFNSVGFSVTNSIM